MTKPDLLLIGSYPEADMAALEKAYQVHRFWEAADKQAVLREIGPRIRAIGTRGDLTVPGDLIAALPRLEIIGCYGVGVDGIDLAVARSRKIAVTNTPDVLTDEVADLALALVLAIARKIPQAHLHVTSGAWKKDVFPLATKTSGKRLGIIGMGRIGQAIAERAAAFKMDISYYNRSPKQGLPYKACSTIEQLAEQSDFLVAALAGGKHTERLVSAEVLKALGPKGLFINVARGSVVDEPALLAALEAKTIAGAALDVFLNEPDIDPRFMKLDNVVLLPHVGSATVETRAAMGKLVLDNLAAHFAGDPLLTPVP